MGKMVAIINNKGGSAKTTTAINIAGAYAMKNPNKKVLIIETDGQGNATRSFNMNAHSYEKTMYDIFMDNFSAEECVVNAFNNIDIIPANSDMNFVEFDEMNLFKNRLIDKISLAFESSDVNLSVDEVVHIINNGADLTEGYFNMLKGKLDSLVDKYDLVVFDTPPELKAVTSSVLAIADEAVIPFEPDSYSIDGIINILSRIAKIKNGLNPDLNIAGILAVKVKGRTNLHVDTINKVMRYCMKNNLYYFQTEIPNTIKFAESTSVNGLPATIAQSKNVFVEAYYKLLDEMIERGVIDNG